LPILEVKTEPIIVKGFAEPSDDRITIRATDIKSFKELRSESTIHISITDTNATRDKLFGLKKIVESYPGESLLHLHINSDKEEAIVEVSRYKVDIDKQFISEVESLLGEKSLRIS